MKALAGKSAADGFYVLKVSGFKLKAEIAAVNITALVGVLMMYGGDVSSLLCNYAGNLFELSRLVHKLNDKLTVAP